MKMQKPEMEVVRFLAEDILTVSGPSHYVLNGVLHTPDLCAGFEHAHVTDFTSYSFTGELFYEDGTKKTATGVSRSNVSESARTDIEKRLADGDTDIWISKSQPYSSKYVICNSGKG